MVDGVRRLHFLRFLHVHAPVLTRTMEPTHAAPLVGRASELAAVLGLLHVPGWVSVVGAPGVGKSRLASEVCQRLADIGVVQATYWVDLSTEADPRAALQQICTAVRASRVATDVEDSLQDVIECLQERGETLLWIDNAERVMEGLGGWLVTLVRGLPSLRLLVTTRQAARHAGERLIRLEPLEEADAIELYGLLCPSGRSDPALPALMSRLDGLPLTITLAASRGRVLSAGQMLELLRERFQLLQEPDGVWSPRTTSLRQALQWSWDMLRDWEKEALAQCAVFAGTFLLPDAEEVMLVSAPDAGPTWVVDRLQALYDRSLLQVFRPSSPLLHGMAYALHHSVREFVLEEADPALVQQAMVRHAHVYLRRAEHWSQHFDHVGELEALAWFESQRANLMAVIERSLACRPDIATSMLLAIDVMLRIREPFDLVMGLYDRVLEATPAQDTRARARLLCRSAHELLLRGGTEEGRVRLEAAGIDEAVEASPSERFQMLITAGLLAMRQGHLDEAEARLQAAGAIPNPRRSGDPARLALYRGMVESTRADAFADERPERLQAALRHYEEALAISSTLRVAHFHAVLHANIGNVYARLDLRAEQRYHYERSLTFAQEVGHRLMEALALANLAWVALLEDDLDRAEALLRRSLPLQHLVRRLNAEGLVHQRLGFIHALRSQWSDAADHLLRAMDLFERCAERRFSIDTEIVLTFVRMAADRPGEARTQAERCQERARTEGDPSRMLLCQWVKATAAALHRDGDLEPLLDPLQGAPLPRHHTNAEAIVTCLQCLIDAARTDGLRDPDGARARWERFREAGPWPRQLLDLMPDTRILASLTARRMREWLEPADTPPPAPDAPPALRIDAAFHTLWLPGRGPVDIHRRRVVRALFRTLVEQRLQHPGRPVHVQQLVQAAWPGERLVGDSGANRVYVAIATLRALGLGPLLHTRSGGYLLDPFASIEVEREP